MFLPIISHREKFLLDLEPSKDFLQETRERLRDAFQNADSETNLPCPPHRLAPKGVCRAARPALGRCLPPKQLISGDLAKRKGGTSLQFVSREALAHVKVP